MNNGVERLLAAATAYQPVWDGDLDRLVRRAHVRRLKAAAAAATLTTALAAVVAIPAVSEPRRLGVTADRSGLEQRPAETVPQPPADGAEVLPPGKTSGTTTVPGTTSAPGAPGQPGADGRGGSGPARPGTAAAATAEPAPNTKPTPKAEPTQQWWERYDSPQPDPGVYRTTTFGAAPYYSRSYGEGHAATYCTNPLADPVVPPLPGEPRPICTNFWYGVDADRDTFVVMHSACVPEDDPAWTYDYPAGQEHDVYLWDDTEGTKNGSTAIYAWSRHATPMPAHRLTIEPGDCMQYVWHLDLRNDAGDRLDPTRKYLIGGEMHGGWSWYGEEFHP